MQSKITVKEVKAGETLGSSHPNLRYIATLSTEDIAVVLSYTGLSESDIKTKKMNVLLHYRPSLAGENSSCFLPHMMRFAEENFNIGSASKLAINIISHTQSEHTDKYLKEAVIAALESINPKPFYLQSNGTINLEKVTITLVKFDAFELNEYGKPIALINRPLQDVTNIDDEALKSKEGAHDGSLLGHLRRTFSVK